MQKQNEKLTLDLAKQKGALVDVGKMREEVLGYNAIVKRQILALPYQLGQKLADVTDQRECSQILEEALVKALNSLAWEDLIPQDHCPTCHQRLTKEDPPHDGQTATR